MGDVGFIDWLDRFGYSLLMYLPSFLYTSITNHHSCFYGGMGRGRGVILGVPWAVGVAEGGGGRWCGVGRG